MKTATTLMLTCILSAIFATTVFAQNNKHSTDNAENKQARHTKMIDRVVKKLDLDDGRAFEVRTILNETHTARKALSKKRGEQAQALRKSTTEKLANVLTHEELKKFKKISKKSHKKMKHKMKHKMKKEHKNKKDKKSKKEAAIE